MQDLPPDPTDIEDTIHAALFGGDFAQVLAQASQCDPWLSAHMAQIMEPLIERSDEPDEYFFLLSCPSLISHLVEQKRSLASTALRP